jgi:branched-chain amino acid aminotransferase
VDRIVVGKGEPGPITRSLQARFLSIVQGQAEDKYGWLTLCHQPVGAAR